MENWETISDGSVGVSEMRQDVRVVVLLLEKDEDEDEDVVTVKIKIAEVD